MKTRGFNPISICSYEKRGGGWVLRLTRSEVRIAVSLTANCELRTVKLMTVNCLHGFACGGKNPIGKSFAVLSPAGAFKITGMELTATEAVAMSPCEPPGMVKLMFGCPVRVTVSDGSFAPTYICNSM